MKAHMVRSWPKLLPRAMPGPVVLLQLGFVSMSVVQLLPKARHMSVVRVAT